MLIAQKPKDSLNEFLVLYKTLYNIDIEKAKNIIINLISYYRGNKNKYKKPLYVQNLEDKWYNALQDNQIDYSIYNGTYYFIGLWTCWIVYSRQYIKAILNKNLIWSKLKNIKSVIDLGCGIGYTTAALTELFKHAEVYGTNLKDTKQYSFCKLMSKKYKFKIISDINKINKDIDLIFASEYFEHIQFPDKHLQDIIQRFSPKFFYMANSFNTRSVGHFLNHKNMSKKFKEILIINGYKQFKTKLWNDKPNFWGKE